MTEFKNKGSKFVRENGYILICKYTGHKIYWYDWKEWKDRQKSFNSEFWDEYKTLKSFLSPSEWNSHPMRQKVSYHFKAASKYDRLALNSPTQGTGIICLKHAMIDFFNWIVANNLFNIVLICNLVHDEAVIEYPKSMPDIAKILQEKMEHATSIYCKKLPIPACSEISDHWVH